MSKKIIIYAVLTVLVIGLLWLNISKRGENIKLIQENNQLQKDIEEAKRAKRRVELFEEKGKVEIEQKEKMVEDRLPINDQNILNIIRELSAIGRNLDITQINFDPQKLVRVSTPGVASQMNRQMEGIGMEWMESYPSEADNIGTFEFGIKTNATKEEFPLYKYPIQIEFQGTYRQIAEFIIQTNQIKRLLTVEDLKINRSEEILPELTASLTINVYTLLSQETGKGSSLDF